MLGIRCFLTRGNILNPIDCSVKFWFIFKNIIFGYLITYYSVFNPYKYNS